MTVCNSILTISSSYRVLVLDSQHKGIITLHSGVWWWMKRG